MYFHVLIERICRASKKQTEPLYSFDIEDKTTLLNEILIPYLLASDFFFGGAFINKKDVAKIRISQTEKNSSTLIDEEQSRRARSDVIYFSAVNEEDVVFYRDYDVTTQIINEAQKLAVHKEEPVKADISKMILHPLIEKQCRAKFEDGYYTDSVESAFKEINSRLKKILQTQRGEEKDGKDLCAAVFSENNPVLKIADDITSMSGKSQQEGYRFLFMGAILAIRNPKAHENLSISKEDAIDRLIFASMLMKKIDFALGRSHIFE